MKFKNILATIILIMAIIQGPYIYYFTGGFFRMLVTLAYGTTGLLLTIYLTIKMIRDKKSNVFYHYFGLALASLIGLLTIRQDAMVYLDWKLRKDERNQVVTNVKQGLYKPNHYGICNISSYSLLPLSNGGNDINIINNKNGIVSIEFYTDRGFIDHYSAIVYTNNPEEIMGLDKSSKNNTGFCTKFEDNWYTIHY